MSGLTAEELTRALKGRWAEGQGIACCPGHADDTPSLSIRAGAKRPVLLKCFAGCSYDAITDALVRDFGIDLRATRKARVSRGRTMKLPRGNGAGGGAYLDLNEAPIGGVDALCMEWQPEEPPEVDARRIHNALAIWRATAPAGGTIVDAYCAARGLSVAAPGCLRFHAGLPHEESGSTWPAMVALIQRASDGGDLGVHRTFLAPDGAGKAPVSPAKKMLGYHKGGVVRLAEPDRGTLMVGEGIETCLSVMQAIGLPAWAALSAGNFPSLDLPAEVSDVLLLIDSDDSGASVDKGLEAAARWHAEGRRVGIAQPPPGRDFNDVLCEAGPGAIKRLCSKAGVWAPAAGTGAAEDVCRVIPFCDEALALAFSDRHADELRYCERLGSSWFEWDGCRWRADEKRRVFTLARRLCRAQSNAVPTIIKNASTAARLAAAVASQRTVAAVVNLARCDERHATGQEEWDADVWAL